MAESTVQALLEAEAAREQRRATLRTRDGVVDLAEWRVARKAAAALDELLGHPAWLLEARVVPASELGFELRVTVLIDDPVVLACLPTWVNDVPLRVTARNAAAWLPPPRS
jgi:hypothetical protein